MNRNVLTCFVPVCLSMCLPAMPIDAEEPLVRWQTTVDLGRDRGQPFGSLFEARDAAGRLVAGAGFEEIYNTRFRGNRHTVQFFVRPAERAGEFQIERLPFPDMGTGVYLFELDGQVHAWTSGGGNRVKRWDAARGAWESKLEVVGGLSSGDGVMRVGRGLLVFRNSRATFDGREILKPPARGRYYNFYYALGHLCFYFTDREAAEPLTRIIACKWNAEDAGVIDVSDGVVFDAKYVGATPFAWGQYGGEALTVTNQGGVHAFDGRRWRTLLEANNQVSYQVYSFLNIFDRALLAQYPTGHLFEYRGGTELKHLDGYPPRLPGVSSRAREAQTTAIYRGEMFAGVWPWAELWRYDHDVDRWSSMGRAFTHPRLTDKQVHPYEQHTERFRLVTNHWGQRITGMVSIGDSLFLSTSSKGTGRWLEEYDFLSEAERREYGTVLKLSMPGHLSAVISWTGKPLALEFLVFADRLLIRQDGREIGRSKFVPSDAKRLRSLKTTRGQGIFGPLRGRWLPGS